MATTYINPFVFAGEELGGMVLLTPTSVDITGGGSETATIGANGSVEFSACTSLSLNGVFDATYDNYMITFQGYNNTSSFNAQARLRSSGTDETGANYVYQNLRADNTTVSGSRTTTSVFNLSRLSVSSSRNGFTSFFYGPFLTQPTAFRSVTVSGLSGGRIEEYAGTHSLSNSYDGITVISESNEIYGLVSVYGLVGA